MGAQDWWILPVTLLALGVLVLFVCFLWASRRPANYGGLGGCFEATIGICGFLICLAMAAGFSLARWLA